MKTEIALKVMTAICFLMLVAPVLSQHAAHVHGEATGTLSLDNGDLRLELELPGYNLVGFEHPPRNSAQAQALQRATDRLGQGQWLELDPGAGCQLRELDAHTHGFEEVAHNEEHDADLAHNDHGDDRDHHHDHNGPQESEHDHSRHDHASFHVQVEWECHQPARLAWIDLKLFDDFPNQSTITVDVLTDRIAARARLRPENVRLDLATP